MLQCGRLSLSAISVLRPLMAGGCLQNGNVSRFFQDSEDDSEGLWQIIQFLRRRKERHSP